LSLIAEKDTRITEILDELEEERSKQFEKSDDDEKAAIDSGNVNYI
jgi:hypothetical protein